MYNAAILLRVYMWLSVVASAASALLSVSCWGSLLFVGPDCKELERHGDDSTIKAEPRCSLNTTAESKEGWGGVLWTMAS